MKNQYNVNRHFHHKGKVFGKLDSPLELSDAEAAEILRAQNPKPDGKRILPCLTLLKPEEKPKYKANA